MASRLSAAAMKKLIVAEANGEEASGSEMAACPV